MEDHQPIPAPEVPQPSPVDLQSSVLEPPPLLSPTPRGRWRWWVHFLVIGFYPLLIGVAGLGKSPAGMPALGESSRYLLTTCATELAIFGSLFGLAVWISRAPKDFLLLHWRGGFWPLPLGVGYSILLRVALGVFVGLLALILIASGVVSLHSLQDYFMDNRPNVEAVVDVSSLRNNPVYFWLTLTLVSFVVAGLREELWRSAFLAGVRGLWPARFSSRKGQLVAVVFAAVIFGLGHAPQGPIAIALTGFLGLGLGAIMVFHKSIWPAVIAHGMFDATSLALLPWALESIKGIHN